MAFKQNVCPFSPNFRPPSPLVHWCSFSSKGGGLCTFVLIFNLWPPPLKENNIALYFDSITLLISCSLNINNRSTIIKSWLVRGITNRFSALRLKGKDWLNEQVTLEPSTPPPPKSERTYQLDPPSPTVRFRSLFCWPPSPPRRRTYFLNAA